MGSGENAQLPLYYSWVWDPQALAQDDPNQTLGIPTSLYFSASSINTESAPEDPEGERVNNSHSSLLAQEAVVRIGMEDEAGTASFPSSMSESSASKWKIFTRTQTDWG